MPKIIVAILYTESWKDIAAITCSNAKKYCDKHGYEFESLEYPEPCKSDFGYGKLELIKEIFRANEADIVWSMDCDTLICRHDIRIEDLLDNEHDAYFTKDYNGLNCGSFIFKNTECSKELLELALGMKGKLNMHCEQDAFSEVLLKSSILHIIDRVKILPQSSINSYMYELYQEIPPQTEEQGQFIPGKSFVLHLPGLGLEHRHQILSTTKIVE